MKKIALVLLFLSVCSCSWRSPNSQFYTMNSTGLQPLSERKVNIAVAKVKVPDLLARSQMVTYDSGSDQVNILEFERWAEVLPDVLQSTVTNDLIAYLPNAYVQRSFFDSQNVNFNINIEINQIQAYRGKKVILTAWWNIADASGRVLARRQGTYKAEVHGWSIESLVNAQSDVVHQMSADIANEILKL